MKEMMIEKTLDLDQRVDRVQDLTLTEEIRYQKEKEGIRAVGELKVEGVGQCEDRSFEFCAHLALDILAPVNKLDPETEYHVSLDHYESEIVEQQLNLKLVFMIDGLLDQPVQQDDQWEDLFDEGQTVMTGTRYILAHGDDTYNSIAETYGVSEKSLMEINGSKPLKQGTLVRLP